MATVRSGTLNLTPGRTIVETVEALLPTQGWVFVESVGVAAGTRPGTYRVWRNPAANSGASVDFFVGLYYGLNGIAAGFTVFERWDAATRLVTRFAPTHATTYINGKVPVAPDGFHPDGPWSLDHAGVVCVGWLGDANYTVLSPDLPYQVAVGPRFLLVSVALETPIVAGLLSPMSVDTDIPVVVGSVGSTSLITPPSGLSATREPGSPTAGGALTAGNYYWRLELGGTLAPTTDADAYSRTPILSRPWYTGRASANAHRASLSRVWSGPAATQDTDRQPFYGDVLTTFTGATAYFAGGAYWVREDA